MVRYNGEYILVLDIDPCDGNSHYTVIVGSVLSYTSGCKEFPILTIPTKDRDEVTYLVTSRGFPGNINFWN